MKPILLSADGEISVYSVPDNVADALKEYCFEFACNWLYASPNAAKYRIKIGKKTGVRFNETDFIDYLNKYVCSEQSMLIEKLDGVYCGDELPKKYDGLPYFNF